MPTAADIRQMIAGEIASFKIEPKAIRLIADRKVWTGSDSIPIRIYYPSATAGSRIIFNIHGGALVGGDLNTHENICREFAARGSVVVALDYRKPPEHPFPAGINDCEAVLQWIKANGQLLLADPKNLVLMGDSGGGLFALALAVKLKKKLGAKSLCLINPAADLRNPGQSAYALVTAWYLNGQNAGDSLASPIVATDFSAFPPTLVITSGKDELKPHGVAVYERLRPFGRAQIVDLPEEDHLGGFWAAGHPRASRAVTAVSAFIDKTVPLSKKKR